MNALIVVSALLIGGYLVFSPRLAKSSGWRATSTPLASIMGRSVRGAANSVD